jgi:hypothetical protein
VAWPATRSTPSIRSSDAERTNLRGKRHARAGPSRRRALGPSSILASSLITPWFWLVSSRARRHRALQPTCNEARRDSDCRRKRLTLTDEP